MVDRSHGRRRDPDRPLRRGRRGAATPRRPLAKVAVLGVIGLILYAITGSAQGPSRGEAVGGQLITESLHQAMDSGLSLTAGLCLIVTGSVAILVSLIAFVWCLNTRAPGSDATRFGLCLAAFCWGLSNLINGIQHPQGGIPQGPTLVNLLGVTMVPIALVAMLLGTRGSDAGWPRLRLVLDSLAVGGAAGFAFWQLGTVRAEGLWLKHGMIMCVLIIADITLLALVALGTVRDVRSRLWPAVAGLAAYATADLLTVLHASPTGVFRVEPLPPFLLCVAWPLIGVGIVRYRGGGGSARSDGDLREAASAQLAAVVVIGMLLAGMMIGRAERPDVTALVLLGEVVVLLCLRELIDALLQLQLTTGLREQALRDTLTGLPNLRALVLRVTELENAADGWVVLTIDVDRFKEINDVLGHRAGDDLLMAVGDVLARERPAGTTAYRVSGDEFAVLARGDLAEGRRLAVSVRDRLRAVLADAAPGMAPSASVGVGRLVGAALDERGTPDERRRRHPLDRPEFGAAQRAEAAEIARHELSALVESAAALRAAKLVGPGAVEIYSGQVAANRERRMLLESRLRTVVATGRIRTVAQPIVDLATGRLTGFEALARWRDEELGDISPVEFIEIAEQTGMVVELGRHVLVVSIEHAATAGVFAAGKYVAINVSPIQLRVPGFVDLMREQLARHSVSASQVVVEVTEAIMVAEDDPALRALAELNALGVRVAIDDFGTGYSALGYLRRLPVQILKIDKSLTSSLMSEPRTTAIVEGVVRMAHRMGIRVVMEGIEDELEAESCRSVDADSGQGWLFGRPTEWFQVADALREEATRDAPDQLADVLAALPAQRLQGDEPAEPADSDSPEVHAGH